MSRKKIVAANWKMNLTLYEGEKLISQLLNGLPDTLDCEIVLAPPFTHLPMLIDLVKGTSIFPAAQHCHAEVAGAYTGEVSVGMLKSLGIKYCITGHSERRQLFFETNQMVRAKVDAILDGGLTPIFCCGESLDIRQASQQNQFVKEQLEECIFHLGSDAFSRLVIAYEPIWAIGTGMTASSEQAQEMHLFIRDTIRQAYDSKISNGIRILYGGSIKADNAATLFAAPDVDGGLVGGASLQPAGFLEIIQAAC